MSNTVINQHNQNHQLLSHSYVIHPCAEVIIDHTIWALRSGISTDEAPPEGSKIIQPASVALPTSKKASAETGIKQHGRQPRSGFPASVYRHSASPSSANKAKLGDIGEEETRADLDDDLEANGGPDDRLQDDRATSIQSCETASEKNSADEAEELQEGRPSSTNPPNAFSLARKSPSSSARTIVVVEQLPPVGTPERFVAEYVEGVASQARGKSTQQQLLRSDNEETDERTEEGLTKTDATTAAAEGRHDEDDTCATLTEDESSSSLTSALSDIRPAKEGGNKRPPTIIVRSPEELVHDDSSEADEDLHYERQNNNAHSLPPAVMHTRSNTGRLPTRSVVVPMLFSRDGPFTQRSQFVKPPPESAASTSLAAEIISQALFGTMESLLKDDPSAAVSIVVEPCSFFDGSNMPTSRNNSPTLGRKSPSRTSPSRTTASRRNETLSHRPNNKEPYYQPYQLSPSLTATSLLSPECLQCLTTISYKPQGRSGAETINSNNEVCEVAFKSVSIPFPSLSMPVPQSGGPTPFVVSCSASPSPQFYGSFAAPNEEIRPEHSTTNLATTLRPFAISRATLKNHLIQCVLPRSSATSKKDSHASERRKGFGEGYTASSTGYAQTPTSIILQCSIICSSRENKSDPMMPVSSTILSTSAIYFVLCSYDSAMAGALLGSSAALTAAHIASPHKPTIDRSDEGRSFDSSATTVAAAALTKELCANRLGSAVVAALSDEPKVVASARQLDHRLRESMSVPRGISSSSTVQESVAPPVIRSLSVELLQMRVENNEEEREPILIEEDHFVADGDEEEMWLMPQGTRPSNNQIKKDDQQRPLRRRQSPKGKGHQPGKGQPNRNGGHPTGSNTAAARASPSSVVTCEELIPLRQSIGTRHASSSGGSPLTILSVLSDILRRSFLFHSDGRFTVDAAEELPPTAAFNPRHPYQSTTLTSGRSPHHGPSLPQPVDQFVTTSSSPIGRTFASEAEEIPQPSMLQRSPTPNSHARPGTPMSNTHNTHHNMVAGGDTPNVPRNRGGDDLRGGATRRVDYEDTPRNLHSDEEEGGSQGLRSPSLEAERELVGINNGGTADNASYPALHQQLPAERQRSRSKSQTPTNKKGHTLLFDESGSTIAVAHGHQQQQQQQQQQQHHVTSKRSSALKLKPTTGDRRSSEVVEEVSGCVNTPSRRVVVEDAPTNAATSDAVYGDSGRHGSSARRRAEGRSNQHNTNQLYLQSPEQQHTTQWVGVGPSGQLNQNSPATYAAPTHHQHPDHPHNPNSKAFRDIVAALQEAMATIKDLETRNKVISLQAAEMEGKASDQHHARTNDDEEHQRAMAQLVAKHEEAMEEVLSHHTALSAQIDTHELEADRKDAAIVGLNKLLGDLTTEGEAVVAEADTLRRKRLQNPGFRMVTRDTQTAISTTVNMMSSRSPSSPNNKADGLVDEFLTSDYMPTSANIAGGADGETASSSSSPRSERKEVNRLVGEVATLRNELRDREEGQMSARWRALMDSELKKAEERFAKRNQIREEEIEKMARQMALLEEDKVNLVQAMRGLQMAKIAAEEEQAMKQKEQRRQLMLMVGRGGEGSGFGNGDYFSDTDNDEAERQDDENGLSSGGIFGSGSPTAEQVIDSYQTLQAKCRALENSLESARLANTSLTDRQEGAYVAYNDLLAQNVTLKHALAIAQQELSNERVSTRSLELLKTHDSDANREQKRKVVQGILDSAGRAISQANTIAAAAAGNHYNSMNGSVKASQHQLNNTSNRIRPSNSHISSGSSLGTSTLTAKGRATTPKSTFGGATTSSTAMQSKAPPSSIYSQKGGAARGSSPSATTATKVRKAAPGTSASTNKAPSTGALSPNRSRSAQDPSILDVTAIAASSPNSAASPLNATVNSATSVDNDYAKYMHSQNAAAEELTKASTNFSPLRNTGTTSHSSINNPPTSGTNTIISEGIGGGAAYSPPSFLSRRTLHAVLAADRPMPWLGAGYSPTGSSSTLYTTTAESRGGGVSASGRVSPILTAPIRQTQLQSEMVAAPRFESPSLHQQASAATLAEVSHRSTTPHSPVQRPEAIDSNNHATSPSRTAPALLPQVVSSEGGVYGRWGGTSEMDEPATAETDLGPRGDATSPTPPPPPTQPPQSEEDIFSSSSFQRTSDNPFQRRHSRASSSSLVNTPHLGAAKLTEEPSHAEESEPNEANMTTDEQPDDGRNGNTNGGAPVQEEYFTQFHRAEPTRPYTSELHDGREDGGAPSITDNSISHFVPYSPIRLQGSEGLATRGGYQPAAMVSRIAEEPHRIIRPTNIAAVQPTPAGGRLSRSGSSNARGSVSPYASGLEVPISSSRFTSVQNEASVVAAAIGGADIEEHEQLMAASRSLSNVAGIRSNAGGTAADAPTSNNGRVATPTRRSVVILPLKQPVVGGGVHHERGDSYNQAAMGSSDRSVPPPQPSLPSPLSGRAATPTSRPTSPPPPPLPPSSQTARARNDSTPPLTDWVDKSADATHPLREATASSPPTPTRTPRSNKWAKASADTKEEKW